MIKPKQLKVGDTVAIVSLSSGLAGESNMLWRTRQGIQRLENEFGLKVKVMPNALKGVAFIHNHPECRAKDLNEAVKDQEVKAIISCIGGEDAIRILPYVDFQAIANNPKIFSGYSDTTTVHLMFYKMGIVSFYGQALLTDFAENIAMDTYTVENINKCWFNTNKIGKIEPAFYMRPYGLKWNKQNKYTCRAKIEQKGYEILNGNKKVSGHLLGGNLETFVDLMHTSIFPEIEAFNGAILFLETSEDTPTPDMFAKYLEELLKQGILNHLNGMVFGKPFNNVYYENYKREILKIIKKSNNPKMVVFYNLSFGHNEPKHAIPYGLTAQIDPLTSQFSIDENSVIST
ncbi:S66 family peptidase [Staphylococcus ureilyticus]|uniref:S66 family peptidase n=1 Tax=Staphylococcus ureilyticus TaxID=94138 RepID=UPI000D1C5348|nr:S66 peptidase family protein [Staphylococcus ureilyticus]MDU0461772.1 LD-carboxypeptidase [Staphylococcus ureilyticus]PTF27284.1 LD-carboxypeptidase [Staphylococcus cohnii]